MTSTGARDLLALIEFITFQEISVLKKEWSSPVLINWLIVQLVSKIAVASICYLFFFLEAARFGKLWFPILIWQLES